MAHPFLVRTWKIVKPVLAAVGAVTVLLSAVIFAAYLYGKIHVGNEPPQKPKRRYTNAPASYKPCHAEGVTFIPFTHPGARDRLFVSVDGSPCWSATFTLHLADESGRMVYEYISEFKPLTATDWLAETLDDDARNVVDDTLHRSTTPAANLPPWMEPEKYEDLTNNILTVDRNRYERIRASKFTLLTHLTGYEAWRAVVFDPDQGRAIILYQGGY